MHTLRTLQLIRSAALTVLVTGSLSAQSLTPAQRTRIDSIFAPFDGTTRPGCALGVGMNGVSVYEHGYGMSDLQHGVPITPQSIFHVASVSKQFTAFAVGLLAQDGKLSLDDEVMKKDGWHISIPDFDTHGATSLFTTVGDLIKWQHNFESMQVGSPSLIKDALTSAVLNDGKPANYGFGISTGKYRGTDAFGHGGADAGYRADVVRFPEHHLEIAVECNFADATPNVYSRAVADVVLEGKLAPVPPKPAPAAKSVALSDERLRQLVGAYKSPKSDQTLVIALKDGQLRIENYDVPMIAVDETHFTAFGTPVTFEGDAKSIPTGVNAAALGATMLRMPPFTPKASELAAFAGNYWSDELRVSYRVELKDSTLVIHPFKRDAETLKPAFADAFTAGDAGTVRFTRTKGVVSGFRLTGGRVRSVAFAKEKGGAR